MGYLTCNWEVRDLTSAGTPPDLIHRMTGYAGKLVLILRGVAPSNPDGLEFGS